MTGMHYTALGPSMHTSNNTNPAKYLCIAIWNENLLLLLAKLTKDTLRILDPSCAVSLALRVGFRLGNENTCVWRVIVFIGVINCFDSYNYSTWIDNKKSYDYGWVHLLCLHLQWSNIIFISCSNHYLSVRFFLYIFFMSNVNGTTMSACIISLNIIVLYIGPNHK